MFRLRVLGSNNTSWLFQSNNFLEIGVKMTSKELMALVKQWIEVKTITNPLKILCMIFVYALFAVG